MRPSPNPITGDDGPAVVPWSRRRAAALMMRGAVAPILGAVSTACTRHPGPKQRRRRRRLQPDVEPGALRLAMRSEDGRFLVTSDGAPWEVSPGSRMVASHWRNGIPVNVLRSPQRTAFGYRLVNRLDGSYADAKLGKRLD